MTEEVNEEEFENTEEAAEGETGLIIADTTPSTPMQGNKVVELSISNLEINLEDYEDLPEHKKIILAYNAKILPSTITSPQAALSIWQRGKELGFSGISVFDIIYYFAGKTSLSLSAMVAIFLRNGGEYEVIADCQRRPVLGPDGKQKEAVTKEGKSVPQFDAVTEIEVMRPGWKSPKRVLYAWSDAVKAGLSTKHNWETYPKEMMFARCFSRMIKRYCADWFFGLVHTPEEINPNMKVSQKGDTTVYN